MLAKTNQKYNLRFYEFPSVLLENKTRYIHCASLELQLCTCHPKSELCSKVKMYFLKQHITRSSLSLNCEYIIRKKLILESMIFLKNNCKKIISAQNSTIQNNNILFRSNNPKCLPLKLFKRNYFIYSVDECYFSLKKFFMYVQFYLSS